MRSLLLVPLLALLAAPTGARAELTLRMSVFSDGAGSSGDASAAPRSADRAHLVAPLRLGDLADAGSGAGTGNEPVLALILGIFPGFGLGHYVAGAAWQTWTVIDVLLLVGLIVVGAVDSGPLWALAWIATVVERVIEGLDAYHKAGGGRIAARMTRREVVVASGPPVPAPAAALDAGLGRTAEVVLARF